MVLFNGCSWTYGDELPHAKEELRYSHFTPNSINIARNGNSNDFILHSTLEYLQTHEIKPSAIVIQWTHTARGMIRQEDNSIIQFTPNSMTRQNKNRETANKFYDIYTVQYGEDNLWKNNYIMQSYCDLNDIQYVPLCIRSKYWTTQNQSIYKKMSKEPYDIELGCLHTWHEKSYGGRYRVPNDLKEPDGHPSIKAHQMIGYKVKEILDNGIDEIEMQHIEKIRRHINWKDETIKWSKEKLQEIG